jgi:fructose-1,6-bisphosphatase I
MSKLVTIERHILDQERQIHGATGMFSDLLRDIALAAKLIARETTRAGLVNILGSSGHANVHGEIQQNLDLLADQTIFRMNDHTGRLCVMASEENEEIIPIPEQFPAGKYVLIYDPLDGSDNIDINASTGTIFAIYRKISDGDRGTLEDVLQPGRELVAAGYVLFGPSTIFVYSTGLGVHGFTLDPSVGEFLLSHENIRIPETPKYYSCNQGNQRSWTEGVQRFVGWCQGLPVAGEALNPKPLQHRYIGALVADFHRNLLKGGIYMYPGSGNKLSGKLRLTYEGAPLAFLMEQAGGAASDGCGPIIDMRPHTLHQRVPLFIGNRSLVEKVTENIAKYDSEYLEAYRKVR